MTSTFSLVDFMVKRLFMKIIARLANWKIRIVAHIKIFYFLNSVRLNK